jgi:hypothetical protein
MQNPNRTRDLPACSAVPQRTASPRAPRQSYIVYFNTKTEIYKTISLTVIYGFETCFVSMLYHRGRWWALKETVMNLRVTETAGNFLTIRASSRCPKN